MIVIKPIFLFLGAIAVFSAGCSNSKDSKLEVDLTRYVLRGLVKNIEFYNVINGAYPAALADISASNDHIELYDSVVSNAENKCEYYYVRHQSLNECVLMSAGVDKKLWTQDDIFPDLSAKEEEQVGWRRKLSTQSELPNLKCL